MKVNKKEEELKRRKIRIIIRPKWLAKRRAAPLRLRCLIQPKATENYVNFAQTRRR